MTNASGWSKGIVHWKERDTLYLSVPFTWNLPEAVGMARRHDGPVIAGGPAISLMGCEGWATFADKPPEGVNVLAMHNSEATFTTRGCVRQCAFCAVPKIEGAFRELYSWEKKRLVCDNAFLSASRRHIKLVVRSLLHIEGVDFNQGLDARLFTDWHASELSRLKKPMIRFAFDDSRLTDVVGKAVRQAQEHGFRDIRVYVLIGFHDSPEDALTRLETVRRWGVLPNPMRYQPLNSLRKNMYVAPEWTSGLLQDVMRYYSRLNWIGHVSWEDYREHENTRRTVMQVKHGPRKLSWMRGRR